MMSLASMYERCVFCLSWACCTLRRKRPYARWEILPRAPFSCSFWIAELQTSNPRADLRGLL